MNNLRDLAPLHLRNKRVRRYQGDDLCVAMSGLATSDQAIIRDLYAFLKRLCAIVKDGSGESRHDALLALLGERSADQIVEMTRRLGPASCAVDSSPLLSKTIHDVRGGGLTPLLGLLQFVEIERHAVAMDALYFLSRDHLKIMRNALLQLDDATREADLLPKIHDTRMIAEKHSGALLRSHGRAVHLEVVCPEHVAISECCVEFGALDRILYNLLNNACRHAATDHLKLALLPVPDASGENLRLVVVNTVSEADLKHLQSIDLGTLFKYGVSTTGSGSGLSVAAQFVANAFGLNSPEEAVAAQYLGARLIGDEFHVWFHWPVLAEY